MSEENDRLVSEHAYDGIQEYDNPLPFWWLVTFFATIIFGFNYWIHYEFGGAPTQRQELKEDLARIEQLHPKSRDPKKDEEELAKLAGNAAVMSKGGEVYASKCAACHGQELQGLIGPNLVDDYWIHGKGSPADIAKVVRTGVLDKGMPNWDAQLKDDEISAVALFVASKRGSTPANAKPPQGEKVVGN